MKVQSTIQREGGLPTSTYLPSSSSIHLVSLIIGTETIVGTGPAILFSASFLSIFSQSISSLVIFPRQSSLIAEQEGKCDGDAATSDLHISHQKH